MSILAAIFGFVRTILPRRATLALENLALRQQLGVLRRSVKRPRIQPGDRVQNPDLIPMVHSDEGQEQRATSNQHDRRVYDHRASRLKLQAEEPR